MTERLISASPRHSAAVRFGELMTAAMTKREVGQNVVKAAAGVSRASIVEFRNGRNLPTLEVALRIAEALNEPRLAEIVRASRTFPCQRCGRPVLNEHGFPKKYCSASCRVLMAGQKRRSKAEEAVMVLRGELLRIGPVRKQEIGRALTLLDDHRAPEQDALAALDAYQDGVAAMCAGCEPEGLCRTPECPLRGVSPLPLESNNVEVRSAIKPAGRWGSQELRATWAEKMRQRWTEPGRKEAQSARSLASWATRDRAAIGQKISATKRARTAA